MSSRNYETQILDSIQMIVDNAISKANFDKTIKAIVSGTSNAAEGKYTVLYQGNPMVVYSSNPDVRYTKNMEVYVLIPGNDATQRKVIIGAVDNLGLDYASIVEGDAGYALTGLANLGYDEDMAGPLLKEALAADPDLSVGEALRAVLKAVGKGKM